MQEEKDREPDGKNKGNERRSTPLKPYSKPETPAEEPETISLLDLMAEEAEDQGQVTPILPPEVKTVELPPLVPSSPSSAQSQPKPVAEGDDQSGVPSADTPTATIRPPSGQTPASAGRTERPLTHQEFDVPQSTPTVGDTEATRVQPRVAFPGATQLQPPAGTGQHAGQTGEQATQVGKRPPGAGRPPAQRPPAPRPAQYPPPAG